MTVKQLIEELKKYPEDLPVATIYDIDHTTKDDPNWIRVTEQTWTQSNYPYDKPDFTYINLE